MVDFKARRHRLEIPPMPKTDDPAILKAAMDNMKRLVQDEFNRLATDFYDFKKATFDAAILPLPAPSNIVVTKTEFSMTATWENPDATEIVPTHVRVRILEISPNTWAEYTWPKSSWAFSGLTPGTQYTFQVQLVARFEATDTFVSTTRNCPSVPVLRTAESDVRAKVFTTDTGVGPPTDNGTNDDQVIFTFPDTDGTPGAVGSANCWWGYKFQYRTVCAWADTAVSEAFAAGNVGDVTIDTGNAPFSTYPDTLFRLAYREICDGVAGAWTYGEPFMAVDYSNADCLGISKSASLSLSPFTTADMFALPSVCQADGTWLQIVDALTDVEFFPQEPGFKCIEYIDDEWTLLADDTTDTAISNTIYTGLLNGTSTPVGNLTDVSDFTLGFDIYVPDNSLVLAGGSGAYPIVKIGHKITASIIQNTSTFDITVTVPRDGGGAYVFRAENCAYAAWQTIYYVHDVSEADGRKLYLNGDLVDQSANAIENDFAGIDNTVEIYTVNEMRFRRFYMWDEAVAAIPAGVSPVEYVDTGFSGAEVLIDSVDIPTHNADDIGVLFLFKRAGGTTALDTPSGWTELASGDSTAPTVDTSWSYSYKVLDGVETSVDTSLLTEQATMGAVVVFRPAAAVTPLAGATGAVGDRNDGDYDVPAGGAGGGNALNVIAFWASDSTAPATTIPTFATQQATDNNTSGYSEVMQIWTIPNGASDYAGETAISGISGATGVWCCLTATLPATLS